MKLMILTCAVFPDEATARQKLWIFLRSCEKFGIEPHLYGIGEAFPGYRAMKLDMQLEYLKNHRDDVRGYTHVLYTDSWDAFFTGPQSEIIAKYERMGSPPILSSAFYQLGNVSDEEKQYPNCFDHSIRYRYPNVGGYLAAIPTIIDAFERMLKLPRQTGDDCFNWYDAWQEGWFRPTLDSNCEIFQVTDWDCVHIPYCFHSQTDSPLFDRLRNSDTGSLPCILHLSGGYTSAETGKDDRMKPWARKLGIL